MRHPFARVAGLLAALALAGCGPVMEISRDEEPAEAEQSEEPAADDSQSGSADPDPNESAEDAEQEAGRGDDGSQGDEPEETPRPVTVAFGGDVHAEPPVSDLLAEGGNPLEAVSPIFHDADLSIVNLETAVGSAGSPAAKQFNFQAPGALLEALSDGGIDVVTVANNHALDYGIAGLEETIGLAKDAGLDVVGAGDGASEAYAPHYAEAGGQTIGVVGLTRVIPAVDWAATDDRPGMASTYEPGLPDALAAIEEASQRADWVMVAVHWGQERHPCPDGTQRDLARAFVDAGADAVVGHHPHVLQGVQELDGAVVAYSLGNFVWYASGEDSRTTGVLTVTLDPEDGTSWAFDPAMIDASTGSPQPVASADPERADAISDLVAARSPGGDTCAGTDWP